MAYYLLKDFLSPDHAEQMLVNIVRHRREFQLVTGQLQPDARRFYAWPAAAHVVSEFALRLRSVLPRILSSTGNSDVSDPDLEYCVFAYVDRSFFRMHTDDYGFSNHTRRLSYVYYLQHEPRRFAGGELVVYDSSRRHREVIEPNHNSIVFFASNLEHEVVPVAVPSRDFEDSRFTVAGWVSERGSSK